MQTYNVGIRWCPGHTGIEGNETADKLADKGAEAAEDGGLASQPTSSGIGTIMRELRDIARKSWWDEKSQKLSAWYRAWHLSYTVKKPKELDLPRTVLHRLLALRTSHGDFHWYHTKFRHEDANNHCTCGGRKSPDHLVRCRKAQRHFSRWPQRPDLPPTSRAEGLSYLRVLLEAPKDFARFLNITGFYNRICPR